ncbi:MAG: hypothetical protein ACK5XA_13800 [Tagaea sp.]
MRSLFALGLAVTAFAAVGSVRANELVVLDAKGVELAAGAKIDGSAKLTLPAGARLTLVAADGRTIKLRGPYEEAPAPSTQAAQANMGDALRNLMNQRGAGTAQLGVVRAAGEGVDLPEPWIVDVARSGSRCLPANAAAVLWGPSFGEATEIKIEPADRSWRARGNWPAGQDRLALPATIPISDGTSYQIDLGGNPAAIVVYRIPAALADPVAQAAWMLEKGCEDQARALARMAAR